MGILFRLAAMAAFAGSRGVSPILPLGTAGLQPIARAASLPVAVSQPLTLPSPVASVATLQGALGPAENPAPLALGRASAEASLAGLAQRFDGAKALRAEEASVPAGGGGGFTVAAYLRSTIPEDQPFVDATAISLRRSKTGRIVLRRLDALAQARGRPVPVEIADIRPLSGEFSYDTEVVRFKRSLVRRGPDDAAPVLGHELVHVLQRAQGLPSDLFEMELEAYMLDIRITLELGYEYGASPWDRKVEKHFRRGVRPLVKLLLDGLYKDNASVVGLGMDGLEQHVLKQVQEGRRGVARLAARLAKRRGTAVALRKMGHPEEQVRTYEDEELGRLEAKLRSEQRTLAWHESDLAMLRTAEGRDQIRRYARSVMALARRTHRWYTER